MKKQVAEKYKNSYARRLALMACAMGVLLVGVWMLSLSQATAAPPPPLPATFTPTPTRASAKPATGGSIELQAQFSQAWPWDTMHWQELWTVVQWQNNAGEWRTVTGWQGTLDDVVVGGDGGVVGYKMWWVVNADLGKGPFRWMVYKSQGDTMPMVTGDLFDLPDAANTTVTVEVSLFP